MSNQIDYGWGYKADLDEIRIHAILDVTRGLSPECVAACVAAVRATRKYRVFPSDNFHKRYAEAMSAAIALLPKDTP